MARRADGVGLPARHSGRRILRIILRPTMQSTRPIFLDLRRIKLPIGGWVSILHRLSGILLVLALPAGALLLHQALSGPDGFAASAAVLAHPLVRLALGVLAWGLLHHLGAGIRHLLLDLGLGLARSSARRSAWAVLLGALAAALILGSGWLGSGASA